MSTTSSNFSPELWSKVMLDTYKDEIFKARKPRRSKGSQLLRDAALGHPEYPPDPRATPEENRRANMTATEVSIRNQYAYRAAAVMTKTLDNDILDALAYSAPNIRIVSS